MNNVLKIVKYSKKYGAYVIIIDLEDFNLYQLGSWTYSKQKDRISCIHRNNSKNNVYGYRHLHRLIMKAGPGEIVDHINGNPLDNRKENLRITNSLGNCRNRRMNIGNKSGYKGVHFHKNGYWVSQIQDRGEKIHLGIFLDKKEAAKAYNEAALKYHGEFARINEI